MILLSFFPFLPLSRAKVDRTMAGGRGEKYRRGENMADARWIARFARFIPLDRDLPFLQKSVRRRPR